MSSLRQAYLKEMGIDVWFERAAEPPPSAEPVAEAPAAAPPVVEAAAVQPVTPSVPEVAIPAADIATFGWDALRSAVSTCTACALHRGRTQSVFGVGDTQADLLVIGEAPGADEDKLGEPFVGRAGQLLNAMLRAIGLTREQVYIANILKCRPPNNRDPKPEEATTCTPFLSRQIELLQPRAILAVGRISAQWLLHSDTPVGRLRGQTHTVEPWDVPLIVSYHPAYLLRSPAAKAKAWQDLLLVKNLLKSKT